MDVQRELAAALKRIDGDTYKRVLAARARIWQPTPMEQADIDAGIGEHPQARVLRKASDALKGAVGNLARVFAPFNVIFTQPAIGTMSRQQKALNDLAAMLPTEDLERLVRIAQQGTPIWQVEQLATLLTHPRFGVR